MRRPCARRACAVHLTGGRKKTSLPLVGWAGQMGCEVSAGRFSVLFFCFSFLFLLLCFDSVQRPNHFQNS